MPAQLRPSPTDGDDGRRRLTLDQRQIGVDPGMGGQAVDDQLDGLVPAHDAMAREVDDDTVAQPALAAGSP